MAKKEREWKIEDHWISSTEPAKDLIISQLLRWGLRETQQGLWKNGILSIESDIRSHCFTLKIVICGKLGISEVRQIGELSLTGTSDSEQRANKMIEKLCLELNNLCSLFIRPL
jgi:hypothetical protein